MFLASHFRFAVLSRASDDFHLYFQRMWWRARSHAKRMMIIGDRTVTQ